MELEGVIGGEGIVLDAPPPLPSGTRVRVSLEPIPPALPPLGELFADLVVDSPDLPTDLAEQHDHYRLGTPKR